MTRWRHLGKLEGDTKLPFQGREAAAHAERDGLREVNPFQISSGFFSRLSKCWLKHGNLRITEERTSICANGALSLVLGGTVGASCA